MLFWNKTNQLNLFYNNMNVDKDLPGIFICSAFQFHARFMLLDGV